MSLFKEYAQKFWVKLNIDEIEKKLLLPHLCLVYYFEKFNSSVK